MRGKLILIMGPTGSGKGTLEQHVLALHPELVIPISNTTRAMRPGEVDGTHYHFVSREAFEKKIAAEEFLEWATYSGNYYGTPKSSLEPLLERGETVLLEIEVQGVRQLCDVIPKEDRVIVFIDAGSWEELEARVRARAPITETELEARKHRFTDEMTFKPEADIVIENPAGGLEKAKEDFAAVVASVLAEKSSA